MDTPARSERASERASEVAADQTAVDQVTVDEEFWSIVCGDEDLLSAEFDAIVEASTPPQPTRGSRGACWPRRRRPPAPRVDPAVAPGLQRGRPGHVTAYQRSPPRVPRLHPTS